jgi:hypothetical protein
VHVEILSIFQELRMGKHRFSQPADHGPKTTDSIRGHNGLINII